MTKEAVDSQELPHLYPDGIFIYWHPDRNLHPGLKAILNQHLPDHYLIITDLITEERHFPADIGGQVGNVFYGNYEAKGFIQQLLEQKSLVWNKLANNLPAFADQESSNLTIDGGFNVPIPGTNIIIIGNPDISSQGIETYTNSGNKPILLPRLTHANVETDWPSPLYGSHLDTLLTGFLDLNHPDQPIHLYIDEVLLELAKKTSLTLPLAPALEKYFQQEMDLIRLARPLDNNLVKNGACNLKFVKTRNGWLAFVPSIKTLGPDLANDLNSCGYTIVPLGAEQWQQGGGPKCRSLEIKWLA